MFLYSVKKNVYTARFLDASELYSRITLKTNVCIFMYISLRQFLFQSRSKILCGDIGGGGKLTNFLKAARYLGLVKCFTILNFN